MARFQRPAEGTWTEHYPELGTEPVSFEDSISPAFYELEREGDLQARVAQRRANGAAASERQTIPISEEGVRRAGWTT